MSGQLRVRCLCVLGLLPLDSGRLTAPLWQGTSLALSTDGYPHRLDPLLLVTSGGENRRLFLPGGRCSAEHMCMRGGVSGEIRDDTYETASEDRLIICREPAMTN